MNINQAFPSNHVKASDLNDKDVTVTITKVIMERLGDDNKPVVYFEKSEKGQALNKTNANRIADMHGFDTDRWVGQQITIFPTECDFRGDTVSCIRVRPHKPSGNSQAVVPPTEVVEPTQTTVMHEAVDDEDIPF